MAPSHYLNQHWDIVNWTIGNKFQWNINRNSNILIRENAFENVVWKMVAILPRPQCVKKIRRSWDHIILVMRIHIHRNVNVFILMKLSLAALEVTTSGAASDENFVKMTTYLFQCTGKMLSLYWDGPQLLFNGKCENRIGFRKNIIFL